MVVQTVYEVRYRPLLGSSSGLTLGILEQIQRQQGSLDSNGLRYLISMRSFFIYSTTATVPLPSPSSTTTPSQQRLRYRDVVWAFHSDSQDLLLEESLKACEGGKLTWENAKAMGVFMWLKSGEVLVSPPPACARARKHAELTPFSRARAESTIGARRSDGVHTSRSGREGSHHRHALLPRPAQEAYRHDVLEAGGRARRPKVYAQVLGQ